MEEIKLDCWMIDGLILQLIGDCVVNLPLALEVILLLLLLTFVVELSLVLEMVDANLLLLRFLKELTLALFVLARRLLLLTVLVNVSLELVS